MDNAYECTQSRRMVDIFNNGDTRRRDREDILPPVRAIVIKIAIAPHRRILAANARGGSVAYDWGKISKLATHGGIGKTRVGQTNAERLDGAGYHTTT